MKTKYSRMIDEYVKKKYGDLDRGVLSDEVKYKVLFKIYRKKYKQEKALRKAIEKMHRYAPHPAEDTTLCDTCKYQDKNGEFCEQDLVQNKDADCYEYVYKPDEEEKPVTKSCHTCEYSKMSTLSDYMGATTAVLYCEKKKCKCDLLDSQMCEYFKEKKK